jgi:hypothetical protein
MDLENFLELEKMEEELLEIGKKMNYNLFEKNNVKQIL